MATLDSRKAPRTEHREVLDRRLRIVLDILARLPHRLPRPGLELAAKAAKCSFSTLQRLIRRAFGPGITWSRLVTERRMREAERLRDSEGLGLRTIAPLVGYASASTLARGYVRHRGKTLVRGTLRKRLPRDTVTASLALDPAGRFLPPVT